MLNKLFKDRNTKNLSFRKIPFYRLVREVANDYKCEVRINSAALNILQKASETYCIGYMLEKEKRELRKSNP